MTAYLNDIREAIGEILELADPAALVPETDLEGDLGMDSGLMLELILRLEETVPNLVIDQATLSGDDFRTIGSVCAYVAARVTVAEPA